MSRRRKNLKSAKAYYTPDKPVRPKSSRRYKTVRAISVGDQVEIHSRYASEGVKEANVFRTRVVRVVRAGGRIMIAGDGNEVPLPVNSPNVVKIMVKRHGAKRFSLLYSAKPKYKTLRRRK